MSEISAQANGLKGALEKLAADMGGVVKVVSNYRAMWAQASQSSQKPMLLICFVGEKLRGPFADAAVAGRVNAAPRSGVDVCAQLVNLPGLA